MNPLLQEPPPPRQFGFVIYLELMLQERKGSSIAAHVAFLRRRKEVRVRVRVREV